MNPTPKRLYGVHDHWSGHAWRLGSAAVYARLRALQQWLQSDESRRVHLDFDGVGLDRLAADEPELMAQLRSLVDSDRIEPVGGTYAQPYGLFHGGESAVRHLIYGVRSELRHLGRRSTVAWAGAMAPFPQLVQLLRRSGFTAACLVPGSDAQTPRIAAGLADAVQWRGLDSQGLPTLLPGDESDRRVEWLDLGQPAEGDGAAQMPGGATFAELLDGDLPSATVASDTFWHGVTLGKNGDRHPRFSRRCEAAVLYAESLSTLAATLGERYPSWELGEAWTELLSAQHHSNHDHEGESGAVGRHGFGHSLALSCDVVSRTMHTLACRVGRDGVVANPFGWPLEIAGYDEDTGEALVLGPIPPFGYIAAGNAVATRALPEVEILEDGSEISIVRGGFQVIIDAKRGVIQQVLSRSQPRGCLPPDQPLLQFEVSINGAVSQLDRAEVEIHEEDGYLTIRRFGKKTGFVIITVGLAAISDALDLSIDLSGLKRPDPGVNNALTLRLDSLALPHQIIGDSPFAVTFIEGTGGGKRTNGEFEETVERAFTASTFVDLIGDDGSGVLLMHDGSQQFLRTDDGAKVVLTAYDPADGDRYETEPALNPRLRIQPHAPLEHHERYQLAREFEDPSDAALPFVEDGLPDRTATTPHGAPRPDLPPTMAPIDLDGDASIVPTSLSRDTEANDTDPNGNGAMILRVVEMDGKPSKTSIRVPQHEPPASVTAVRTDLLGQAQGAAIEVQPCDPPAWAATLGLQWFAFDIALGAHEIATYRIA